MKEIWGRIEENKEIVPGYFSIKLSGEFPPSNPGQFAMVLPAPSMEPFLRRPLGIAGQGPGWIRFIYKVVGRGTSLLSHLRPGQRLSVISPLGNGFSVEKGRVLLVAGGTGIAPIVYLAGFLKDFVLLYGAKTSRDLLIEEVDKITEGNDVVYVTEDGSHGKKGVLTDYLPERGFSMAYVAGPYPMMRRFSEMYQGRAQYSFEAMMGCGFGVCYSCVVKVRRDGMEKYVRTCVEGPVFNGEEVVWI